jgi:hypothetical protein
LQRSLSSFLPSVLQLFYCLSFLPSFLPFDLS